MAQAPATKPSGWATAIRQRRAALPQRVGVVMAAAMIGTPLLGWAPMFAWIVVYLISQGLEVLAMRPVANGQSERLGLARTIGACAAVLSSSLIYGLPTLPLWALGGTMGGLCAVVMLSAAVLYAVLNAPSSARILIASTAPHFLYLALTPIMMLRYGGSLGYASTAAAAVVIFGAYALVAWQRMTRAVDHEFEARTAAERRQAEAEAAMADRSAFLAAVAHDLRTPISAILAGAAELERTADRSPSRANAVLITDAGLMMKAMLDDLLDHTKLGAGRMTVEVGDLNLRALLAQTVYLWRGPVRAKGLNLRFSGAHEVPAMVRGDAMRLRQVLNNLISNAVKFTPAGSISINVRCWPEEPGGHALLIEIRDTGPGMTAAQVARLFTPYDQTADGVSARHGGTGLGLSISRDLVELMGGRLTAHSRPGQGASFTVSLVMGEAVDQRAPVQPYVGEGRGDIVRALGMTSIAPRPAPTASEATSAETAPAHAASVEAAVMEVAAEAPPMEANDDDEDRPLRVLVVDDHDINRRAVELILMPLGCDISTAADGRAALAQCEAKPFDVVFMDVRMPELDGRETTRLLRAGGGLNADVPVIAVTADTSPEDVAACHAAGMNYFVSKPLTPQALLGALSAVLSGEPEAETETPETAAA